jgi:hypothetical protein
MKQNALIYSVYHDKDYLKLLRLSLTSLLKYGNVDFTKTDIVVFAEESLAADVKALFADLGISHLLNILSVPYCKSLQAASYKFLILTNESTSHYQRFLYLDVDTVISGTIWPLFEVELEDKLYVAKHGSLDDPGYHGNLFTTEERATHAIKDTFTGSVLLFKRGPSVQTLFNNAQMHIRFNLYMSIGPVAYMEQPYLIYQSFRRDCVNTMLLEDYVNNDALTCCNNTEKKPINHFHSSPGCAFYKYIKMREFLRDSCRPIIN